MTYKWADGYNNTAGLADIDPQPASEGVQYHDVRYAGDGSVHGHGTLYIDLVWRSLTRDQYNAIMTTFGLSDTTLSNAGTASIRANANTFTNRNAIATYKLDGQRKIAFWKNVTIRLTKLETIA